MMLAKLGSAQGQGGSPPSLPGFVTPRSWTPGTGSAAAEMKRGASERNRNNK